LPGSTLVWPLRVDSREKGGRGVSLWTVRGRRAAYESEWVNVYLDDVELPGGGRLTHHVLAMPKASVGAVVVDQDRTLLLWRHRYITGRWGWEVPAGWADAGEDPQDAARREIEEETGWRAGHLQPLIDYYPLAGLSTMHYTAYLGTDCTFVRPVEETDEATRVEWVPLADVPAHAAAGQITDGPSLLMLSYYLAMSRQSGDTRPATPT